MARPNSQKDFQDRSDLREGDMLVAAVSIHVNMNVEHQIRSNHRKAQGAAGSSAGDEFCIEIRRESNPRGANLHLIRSSTLTTRPTVYKRLELNVLITCDEFCIEIRRESCDRNTRFQSFIHGWSSG